MTTAIAATATGLALGALMSRGRICFNAGVREAFISGDGRILRVFGFAVAFQLLLLPILVAIGIGPLERSIDAGGPGLFPVAQAVGGLVFGVGMALAGGCITGILWKTGAGSVATGLAILGFAAGELLIQGPLVSVVESLDEASAPASGSVTELTGIPYAPLALALGAAGVLVLTRRTATGIWLGAGLGVIAAAAWIAAEIADYGYGLGFVGAAEGTLRAVEDGDALPFQLFLAVGVLAGAVAAVRGPVRLPDGSRTRRALAGGLLMGFGGTLAHGCNIGHGVTGLPLLSLGSLLAVSAMVAGAVVTWRYVLGPRPALRGTERPEAVGW